MSAELRPLVQAALARVPGERPAARDLVAGYTGGASGPIKAFFFSGDGKYLGTDTPQGSGGAAASRVNGSEIKIKYPIYYAGDPACCPSSTTDVRFIWTDGQLETLDPIPPADERF